MKRMFFALMACMLLANGAEVKPLEIHRPSPEEISRKFDQSAEKLRYSVERLEHSADKLNTGVTKSN